MRAAGGVATVCTQCGAGVEPFAQQVARRGVQPGDRIAVPHLVGQFGTRGLGYDVEQLAQMIVELLGTSSLQPVVLVGVGNLGAALLLHFVIGLGVHQEAVVARIEAALDERDIAVQGDADGIARQPRRGGPERNQ